MTPMRGTFVSLQQLLDTSDVDARRDEINALLINLLEQARDTEEAGAAANYGSAVLIYLDARREGRPETLATAKSNRDVQAQVLTAVMLLRRGRGKGRAGMEQPASL
jgi:hypothetical protein